MPPPIRRRRDQALEVAPTAGRPSLRTPDGVRELEVGEVVRFPRGGEGAHQVYNDGEEAATFLAISSQGRADVVVYPDSDKVGAVERLSRPARVKGVFRRGDRVEYFEGERPPAR